MLKFASLFISFSCLVAHLYGQESVNLNETIEKYKFQPETWAFEKNNEGLVDKEGHFTTTIPVSSISTQSGYTFHVQFNYSSNIKFPDGSGTIGLGWSFNVGSINRTVVSGDMGDTDNQPSDWSADYLPRSEAVDFPTLVDSYKWDKAKDLYAVQLPDGEYIEFMLADQSYLQSIMENEYMHNQYDLNHFPFRNQNATSVEFHQFLPLNLKNYIIIGYYDTNLNNLVTSKAHPSSVYSPPDLRLDSQPVNDYFAFEIIDDNGNRFYFSQYLLDTYSSNRSGLPTKATETKNSRYVKCWNISAIATSDYNKPFYNGNPDYKNYSEFENQLDPSVMIFNYQIDGYLSMNGTGKVNDVSRLTQIVTCNTKLQFNYETLPSEKRDLSAQNVTIDGFDNQSQVIRYGFTDPLKTIQEYRKNKSDTFTMTKLYNTIELEYQFDVNRYWLASIKRNSGFPAIRFSYYNNEGKIVLPKGINFNESFHRDEGFKFSAASEMVFFNTLNEKQFFLNRFDEVVNQNCIYALATSDYDLRTYYKRPNFGQLKTILYENGLLDSIEYETVFVRRNGIEDGDKVNCINNLQEFNASINHWSPGWFEIPKYMQFRYSRVKAISRYNQGNKQSKSSFLKMFQYSDPLYFGIPEKFVITTGIYVYNEDQKSNNILSSNAIANHISSLNTRQIDNSINYTFIKEITHFDQYTATQTRYYSVSKQDLFAQLTKENDIGQITMSIWGNNKHKLSFKVKESLEKNSIRNERYLNETTYLYKSEENPSIRLFRNNRLPSTSSFYVAFDHFLIQDDIIKNQTVELLPNQEIKSESYHLYAKGQLVWSATLENKNETHFSYKVTDYQFAHESIPELKLRNLIQLPSAVTTSFVHVPHGSGSSGLQSFPDELTFIKALPALEKAIMILGRLKIVDLNTVSFLPGWTPILDATFNSIDLSVIQSECGFNTDSGFDCIPKLPAPVNLEDCLSEFPKYTEEYKNCVELKTTKYEHQVNELLYTYISLGIEEDQALIIAEMVSNHFASEETLTAYIQHYVAPSSSVILNGDKIPVQQTYTHYLLGETLSDFNPLRTVFGATSEQARVPLSNQFPDMNHWTELKKEIEYHDNGLLKAINIHNMTVRTHYGQNGQETLDNYETGKMSCVEFVSPGHSQSYALYASYTPFFQLEKWGTFNQKYVFEAQYDPITHQLLRTYKNGHLTTTYDYQFSRLSNPDDEFKFSDPNFIRKQTWFDEINSGEEISVFDGFGLIQSIKGGNGTPLKIVTQPVYDEARKEVGNTNPIYLTGESTYFPDLTHGLIFYNDKIPMNSVLFQSFQSDFPSIHSELSVDGYQETQFVQQDPSLDHRPYRFSYTQSYPTENMIINQDENGTLSFKRLTQNGLVLEEGSAPLKLTLNMKGVMEFSVSSTQNWQIDIHQFDFNLSGYDQSYNPVKMGVWIYKFDEFNNRTLVNQMSASNPLTALSMTPGQYVITGQIPVFTVSGLPVKYDDGIICITTQNLDLKKTLENLESLHYRIDKIEPIREDGRCVQYQYDDFFRLVTVTHPDLSQSTYRYDYLGRVIRKETPFHNAPVINFGKSETDVDFNPDFKYAYDKWGRLLYSQDPNQMEKGTMAYVRYDWMDRVLESGEMPYKAEVFSDILDPTIHMASPQDLWLVKNDYDHDVDQKGLQNLKGNCSKRTEKISGGEDVIQTSYFSYNPEGALIREIKQLPNLEQEETFTYNRLGMLIQNTFKVNGVTLQNQWFEYDAFGWLHHVYESGQSQKPTEALCSYTYNPDGKINLLLLANGKEEVEYHYNLLGWLTLINYQKTGFFSENIHYWDQLANGIIPNLNGNISQVSTQFDSGSQPSDSWFDFDNTLGFTYDQYNQLISSQSVIDGALTTRYSSTYSYYQMGNIGSILRYRAGKVIDNLNLRYQQNRLAKVSDYSSKPDGYSSQTSQAEISYLPIFVDELEDEQVWNRWKSGSQNGANMSIILKNSAVSGSQAIMLEVGTTPLAGGPAAWVETGNVTVFGGSTYQLSVVIETNTYNVYQEIFWYNGNGHLVANHSLTTIMYQNGNRVLTVVAPENASYAKIRLSLKAYHYNDYAYFDNIKLEQKSPFDYDAAGNTIRDINRQVALVTYDHQNLPVSILKTNGDEYGYAYTQSGHRLWKTKNGNITNLYLRDQSGAIRGEWVSQAINPNVNAAFSPVWFNWVTPTGTVPLMLNYINLPGGSGQTIGRMVYDTEQPTRQFYIQDHLGNTRGIMEEDNSQLKLIYAVDYYPFGMVMREWSTTTPEVTKFKYQQKERDIETGYDYFEARLYDSGLGRFMQVDPHWEKYKQVNSYHFCLNNVLRNSDKSGMTSEDEIEKRNKDPKDVMNPVSNMKKFVKDSWTSVVSFFSGSNKNTENTQVFNPRQKHFKNDDPIVPLTNTIVTSEYSNGQPRILTTNNGQQSSPHNGVDLSALINTPVLASEDGNVSSINGTSTSTTGFGLNITLSHSNGYSTRYGHLNSVNVAESTNVSKGDTIGFSGNSGNTTGPHLHFEVKHQNNHIDPAIYVPGISILPRQ